MSMEGPHKCRETSAPACVCSFNSTPEGVKLFGGLFLDHLWNIRDEDGMNRRRAENVLTQLELSDDQLLTNLKPKAL